LEKNQRGVTVKFLDEATDLKVVITDRDITNCRRIIMRNPLHSLAKKAIEDLEGKEWFSGDFLDARLRAESDHYETQLWDMGSPIAVDLESITWDDSFVVKPRSPPFFKRYMVGVDPDTEQNRRRSLL
jgi:hypothetical protein